MRGFHFAVLMHMRSDMSSARSISFVFQSHGKSGSKTNFESENNKTSLLLCGMQKLYTVTPFCLSPVSLNKWLVHPVPVRV